MHHKRHGPNPTRIGGERHDGEGGGGGRHGGMGGGGGCSGGEGCVPSPSAVTRRRYGYAALYRMWGGCSYYRTAFSATAARQHGMVDGGGKAEEAR